MLWVEVCCGVLGRGLRGVGVLGRGLRGVGVLGRGLKGGVGWRGVGLRIVGC